MMKSLFPSTAFALVCAAAAPAAAQSAPESGDACPPGSWFCAGAPQQRAAPAGRPAPSLKPLPDPDDSGFEPEPEPAPAPAAAPRRTPPPPVVIYQPPMHVTNRPEEPPPYEYVRPRRRPISPPHEWGLNLHFEGALIGNGTHGNASLGGVGAGLRFKPIRSFGIEADLDFAGGDHDYQGNKRNETAFMLNGLIFLNPQSHAQIYLLAGFGWSGAHVTCDSCSPGGMDNHYDYFGGQVGAGLELRLGRVLAFSADIRGFVRGRTDGLAQRQPEFDSPAGCSSSPGYAGPCRTTNTSGGGLFTGGMTLYF